MMKIEFGAEFPVDLKELTEPLVNKWKLLIPSWCEYLGVVYTPKRDAVLSCGPNYRNRYATLYITGAWFLENPDEREIALIHEFVHILQAPFDDVANRIVQDAFEKDSPASEFAKSMLLDSSEATVEDIANAIFRLFKAHLSTQSLT